MNVTDQIALVTGTSRGIGSCWVSELLDRGAAKVYASARNPDSITVDDRRVVPLRIDLLGLDSIAAAAAQAGDVTLLVNNAGIATNTPLVTGDRAQIRRELDTHFWGTLEMIRAFAPVLAANGGGAILNVLSALSWFATPLTGAYSAAKAAEWNLTNAVRLELAGQGTFVQGIHLGAADTDITADYDGPKIDPAMVPRAALDALAAGEIEVILDDWTALVKDSLVKDPAPFYEMITAQFGG